MINPDINKISICCDECNGSGSISSCCGAEVDNHRCLRCGKFCKEEPCYDCNNNGGIEYKTGDSVEIFICIYSHEYLFKFYKPKKLGDTKTIRRIIKGFADHYNAVVKINGNLEKIKIEDINQY